VVAGGGSEVLYMARAAPAKKHRATGTE